MFLLMVVTIHQTVNGTGLRVPMEVTRIDNNVSETQYFFKCIHKQTTQLYIL